MQIFNVSVYSLIRVERFKRKFPRGDTLNGMASSGSKWQQMALDGSRWHWMANMVQMGYSLD